jgi:NitT/TauT family transport system ATP-binding protein
LPSDRAMELLVERLTHTFGPLEVLEEISLSVRSGEVLGLVGPSGCGKSTLLSIIGGLMRPTAGTVTIRGTLPPRTLNPITFVFQDFALLPWRTAAANVGLPLEHRNFTRSERQALVNDALARTGLSEFAAALPKQLSGGMRQRVGIARALAVRPALLLMDEPLSALDFPTRELLIEDLIRVIGGSDLAVIYVTHNLEEALRLADRILVLSRRPGRIEAIIPVLIPRHQRAAPGMEGELRATRDKLWSLVRDGALAAEREVADG